MSFETEVESKFSIKIEKQILFPYKVNYKMLNKAFTNKYLLI